MLSSSNSTIITLNGSTSIVLDFFNHSVNNILYQRGIYPPEGFKRTSHFGLSMMVSTDEMLLNYLSAVMKQLKEWLSSGAAQKLVLVVKGLDSGETLERWVFDCECSDITSASVVAKPEKELMQEIQAIIRQITASVTFLPLLNESCCFDLLVYADKEANVPITWEDSDPCFIMNAEMVRLRSFSTKVHKVDVAVSYKVDEGDV